MGLISNYLIYTIRYIYIWYNWGISTDEIFTVHPLALIILSIAFVMVVKNQF